MVSACKTKIPVVLRELRCVHRKQKLTTGHLQVGTWPETERSFVTQASCVCILCTCPMSSPHRCIDVTWPSDSSTRHCHCTPTQLENNLRHQWGCNEWSSKEQWADNWIGWTSGYSSRSLQVSQRNWPLASGRWSSASPDLFVFWYFVALTTVMRTRTWPPTLTCTTTDHWPMTPVTPDPWLATRCGARLLKPRHN